MLPAGFVEHRITRTSWVSGAYGRNGMLADRHVPRRWAWSVCILAVMLAAGSYAPFLDAQRGEAIPTARLINFTEYLTPEVRVAGRVLVGAVVGHDRAVRAAADPLLLLPYGRMRHDQPLCVETVSRDGNYYSRGTLPISALPLAPGILRVVSDTRHADRLRAFGHRDLAILAFAGECVGSNHGTALVFAIDRAETPTRAVTEIALLLNSGRMKTSVVYQGVGGGEVRIACERIESDRRTAFDTVCTLLGVRTPEAAVRIERKRYERAISPIEFRLVLGG